MYMYILYIYIYNDLYDMAIVKDTLVGGMTTEPLWKILVSELGWWNSQYMEK